MRMKRSAKIFVGIAAAALILGACSDGGSGGGESNNAGGPKEDLTFVIVPKVVHPWFDEVNKGAQAQGEFLSNQLGVDVEIDYRAPENADVGEQDSALEQAAETQTDGIVVDAVDYDGNRAVFEEIQELGIPIVLFDSPSPEGSGLTSVGNDFAEQARLASEYLIDLIDGEGKVAVMAGVPTAPNHKERYDTHLEILGEQPGIEIVDGGIDNDSIEEAQTQAAAVIAANPDLDGYLCADAACPIGVANAIEEAGKVDQINLVGMDYLIEILKFIESGVIRATSSTLPQEQGAISIPMLWLAVIGIEFPQVADTAIGFIDPVNVAEWTEIVGE